MVNNTFLYTALCEIIFKNQAKDFAAALTTNYRSGLTKVWVI